MALEMRMVRVKGPALFAHLSGHSPKPFTKDGLSRLHQVVETGTRRVLEQMGGPRLCPISIRVLDKKDFIREFRRVTTQGIEGIDFDRYEAFGFTHFEDGNTTFKYFYNFDAIKHACKSGKAASNTILHEVLGSIYGHVTQRLYLAAKTVKKSKDSFDLAKPDVSKYELSVLSEGWASYLSCIPFDPAFLLNLETAFVANNQGIVMLPEKLVKLRNDRHLFVSLALLKIEMVKGIPALVDLMHHVPGLTETPEGLRLHDSLRELWAMYDEANRMLGMQSLPYNQFTSSVSLVPT